MKTDKIQRFQRILELLEAGKKIKPVSYLNMSLPNMLCMEVTHKTGCTEKIEDKFPFASSPYGLISARIISHSSNSCHEIEYVYSNPQFNRLFAKLKGVEDPVDYSLGFMAIFWTDWEEHKPEMKTYITVDIVDCEFCGKRHIGLQGEFNDGNIHVTCPNTKIHFMVP